MENSPLAYSVKEAIRISSIKKSSLYAAIKDGRLKISKVGRRTLIHAESLRALIGQG
ncbi:helix-turn-helix domain-containing protein [Tsuneonella sp. HG249]